MNKKGFTLIELLAVIVILAIIALIATPIVLDIIKDSKESATLQSAEFYLGAVEMTVAKKILDEPTFKPTICQVQEDGNLKCDQTDVKVDISGETPNSGTITLENGKIKEVELVLSEKTIIKNSEGKLVYKEPPMEPSVTNLCKLQPGVEANTIGAKYSCDFGGGARNFYILELGTNPVSGSTLTQDQVALILEGNYDTTIQQWCDQSGPNPGHYACAADGLISKLDEIASVWSKLDREQIVLPRAEQIVVADGKSDTAYKSSPTLTKTWLYDYPSSADNGSEASQGYWTSNHKISSDTRFAWRVGLNGVIGSKCIYQSVDGVRPVVIIKL